MGIQAAYIDTQQPSLALASAPKVLFIAELFRHGARYPTKNIFDDPVITANMGELSATGMRQQYLLGKAVKASYPDVFSKVYNHTEIEFMSSHVARTVESAVSHLLGMYDLKSGAELQTNDPRYIEPPYLKNLPNSDISGVDIKSVIRHLLKERDYALSQGYRTVPVFTEPLFNDTIFFHNLQLLCPVAEAVSLAHHNALMPRLERAVAPISTALIAAGYDPKEIFSRDTFMVKDMAKLYDNVRYYLYETGKMPAPMTQDLFSKIESVYAAEFLMWDADSGVSRLLTNSLSQLVRGNFMEKVKDQTKGIKYLGLSGHDTTVLPWLKNFEATSVDCLVREIESGRKEENCKHSVEFAANLIWELSKTTHGDEHFLVRVLYNGKTIFDCSSRNAENFLRKTPKYEGYCTLEEYEELAKHLFEVGDSFWPMCNGSPEQFLTGEQV